VSYNPQKLRRAVIKEELVAITDDGILAVVLNQMIFWSERVRDVDNFIIEEKRRASAHGTELIMPLCHGWIYKSANELVDELMGVVSKQTMSRYLQSLCDMGFLTQRKNPAYKWDNTWQYRVNLNAIQKALCEHGYVLEGYVFKYNLSTTQFESWTTHGESSIPQIESIANQNESLKTQIESTIPKITYKDYLQKDTFVPEHEHFCSTHTQETSVATRNTTVTQNQVDNTDNDIKQSVVTDPAFEMFWSEYPKKMEKQKSYRMWKARRKEGLTSEDLLVAAINYADACRNQGTEQKFIKYPATFLGPDKLFTEWIKPRRGGDHDGNNKISSEKEKGNSGFCKKVDFVKFPQHQYREDELNRLFEPIT